MKRLLRLFAFAILTSRLHAADDRVMVNGVEGYTNTPMLPGGKWHVHDPTRPQPPVVTPGPFSTGAAPPSDAIMLFNGKDLSNWVDTNGQPAPWQITGGAMVAKKCDIHTK